MYFWSVHFHNNLSVKSCKNLQMCWWFTESCLSQASSHLWWVIWTVTLPPPLINSCYLNFDVLSEMQSSPPGWRWQLLLLFSMKLSHIEGNIVLFICLWLSSFSRKTYHPWECTFNLSLKWQWAPFDLKNFTVLESSYSIYELHFDNLYYWKTVAVEKNSFANHGSTGLYSKHSVGRGITISMSWTPT